MSDGPDAVGAVIAGRIEREHPGWLVVWGRYSRMFWAWAWSSDAPPHVVIAARDASELVALMRQAERDAARRPRR